MEKVYSTQRGFIITISFEKDTLTSVANLSHIGLSVTAGCGILQGSVPGGNDRHSL